MRLPFGLWRRPCTCHGILFIAASLVLESVNLLGEQFI